MFSRIKNESGQSIILVAVLILSFLMFFSFAVNTGLLISAKISVQSAADAAAYAGAATEGRYLNAISFLNYDMRRQYKKYIFRSNFVGSIGNPGFPNNTTSSGPDYAFEKADNDPAAAQHMLPIKVPTLCLPITASGQADDNCLQVNIRNTTYGLPQFIGGGGLDAITKALYQSFQDISKVQESLCQGHSDMNLFVLISWLFRGDNAKAGLDQLFTGMQGSTTMSQADYDSAKKTAESLVEGLGLFPRNIITLMRINTLVSFLNSNQTHQVKDATADLIQTYETGSEAELMEKSILAFKSAAANLNTSVFDEKLTSMTELQNPKQFGINPILINFNAYVQMMKKGSGDTQGKAVQCASSIFNFPITGAPVGVTIDPSSKVNYAVKIRAFIRPRGLLFLPGSDPLELDAIAGAKPFGSRIGPKTAPSFVKPIQPSPVNGEVLNDCSGPTKCDVPYLEVGAGSNTFSIAWLTDLAGRAKNGGTSVNFQGMLQAQWHAMAPTPEEIGHYNIIPPPMNSGNDKEKYKYEFINYNNDTATDGNGLKKTVYKFYAPLFPANGGDPNGFVDTFLTKIFATTNSSGANAFGVNMKDIGTQVGQTIKGYIQKMDASGELGESSTIASIELPMDNLTPGSKLFWLTGANQVLSSWAPDAVRGNGAQDESGFPFRPRFGYSVKFVSMQNLMSEGVQSDDPDVSNVTH